jgi:hypothetical protein
MVSQSSASLCALVEAQLSSHYLCLASVIRHCLLGLGWLSQSKNVANCEGNQQ